MEMVGVSGSETGKKEEKERGTELHLASAKIKSSVMGNASYSQRSEENAYGSIQWLQ